uniref:Protein TIC 214 n=1 Tax=Araucaria bidwillii TaxID=56993 RepID=A0A5S8YXG2_9CONI|nr:hypothetical chloroplast RF19 [Araucaria bidwillii]ATL59094.1 hypothetical chloroplast RF19 [Araucaria bidwillii]
MQKTLINTFVTFVTFTSAWLQTYNCVLLFGVFYGFLSTLPLSFPQIYFTRSFLLEHDERKRSEFQRKYLGQKNSLRLRESQVIFSGSLLGQTVVFLSIYCAPIYGAFLKPHTMIFITIPIMYVILYKCIEDRSPNRISLLLIGIVLQLLNLTLFFSDSVFTRLINLLWFRYTDNFVFIISLFVGWLSGQIFFIKLAKFFCLRIERDSSLLGSKYTTSKKYIRETFKIIFFGYFFLFCFGGNTPNPIFSKRFNEEIFEKDVLIQPFALVEEAIQELGGETQGGNKRARLLAKYNAKKTSKKTSTWKENKKNKKTSTLTMYSEDAIDAKTSELDEEEEDRNDDEESKPYSAEFIISPWIGKTWPNLFYDYRRWNWPFEYIQVDPECPVQGNFFGPIKTEVSDYFFDTCISDGRERLSYTSTPGRFLSAEMIRQKLAFFIRRSGSVSGSEIDSSNQDQFSKWIVAKKIRRDYLGRELEHRVKALSKGSPILDVIEKRVKFCTESGMCLPEIEDPFLSGPFRGIMQQLRSAWIPLCISKKILLPPKPLSFEDKLAQEISKELQKKKDRLAQEMAEQLRASAPKEEETEFTYKEEETEFTSKEEEETEFTSKEEEETEFTSKEEEETEFTYKEEETEFTSKEEETELPSKEEEEEEETELPSKEEEEETELPNTRRILITEMEFTPEEFTKLLKKFTTKQLKKLSIGELTAILGSLKKEKELKDRMPKCIEAIEVSSVFNFFTKKLNKFMCSFYSVGLTPSDRLFHEVSEIEMVSNSIIDEFALFFKKETQNEDVIGKLREEHRSSNEVFPRLMNRFFFFIDKRLWSLFESEKNEQISDQKEDEDFEKESSAHILFFPENKKVKSIFKRWLPLFDLFQRRKVGEKLENLVISKGKTEKALDLNIYALFKKIFLNELKLSEIKRDAPFWGTNLSHGLYDDYGEEGDFDIASPEVRSALILDDGREDDLVSWIWETDDDRDMVKGAIRAQRRNLNSWMLMDTQVRSSFFVRYSEMKVKSEEIRRKSKKKEKIKGKFYAKANWEKHSRRRFRDMYKLSFTKAEDNRLEELTWMDEDFIQFARSLSLVTMMYIRKYIIIPLFIITKNIVRPLLFQFPEWKEDWEDWGRETYVICDYDGSEYSETEYPEDFWEIGIQIRILSPFRFRPWREGGHSEGDTGYLAMNPIVLTEKPFSDAVDTENQKKEDMFQVLSEEFLGPIRKFWGPRIQELIRRIKELIRPVIKVIKALIIRVKELTIRLRERIKLLIIKIKIRRLIKRIKEWIQLLIKLIKELIRRIKELIRLSRERIKELIRLVTERIKWLKKSELRPDNRSTENIEMNDRIPSQLQIKTKPKIEDQFIIETPLNVNGKERNDEIKQITEKYLLNLEIHTNLKKKIDQYSYDIGSGSKNQLVEKKIQEITARKKSIRFHINRKLRYFKKLFLRGKLIVIHLKLSVIHLIDSILEFLNLLKNKIAAILNNNSSKISITEKIQDLKTGPDRIGISQANDSNTNFITGEIKDFKIGPDRISQAYVFHKMWQIRAMNKSYAKDLLESRTSFPLIKKNIKELLNIQGILDSKEPQDLRANNWKQWLKYCYGYKVAKPKASLFSQIWSRIAPQKRKNRINNQCRSKSEFEAFLGMLHKWNKRYRYDLLAYNYLNPKKEDIHGPVVQDMVVRDIPDHPNTNKKTRKSVGPNIWTLDKSDLKLAKIEWAKIELAKKEAAKKRAKIELAKKEAAKKGAKTEDKTEGKGDDESETNQSNESKTDIKSNGSKTDSNKSETDESLLIEFLDGYGFLKPYWFFPIFAENLELSQVIQIIRSELAPLIEYCQMYLPMDQYLSDLNAYYSELCKEKAKQVKNHDKINNIRRHLHRLNVSLERLGPPAGNFIKKAYEKSDIKLPWFKPDVSLYLRVETSRISEKLLEDETKPPTPETEKTPEETGVTPEENEATPEIKTQLIREEINKIREEGDLKRPKEAKSEIKGEWKASFAVSLIDYLRKEDNDVFIPLDEVEKNNILTEEMIEYKEELARAIDGYRRICTKRHDMSELEFWKLAFWKNLNHLMNEVAELKKFPMIQLNKGKAFQIVFAELQKAIKKQPEKQGNEEKRDDNDKNAYDEVRFQLKPEWEKRNNKNVWTKDNRVDAKMSTEFISRKGGVDSVKEELWFLPQYEYILNTMEFILFSKKKKKSDKSKSDKSKSDESLYNKATNIEDEKVNEKKQKEVSTRVIRQLQKICNRNDATDVVTFLHKFYSKEYPKILEQEQHLIEQEQIDEYAAGCFTTNDRPSYWALLGCYDDRSLVDQMLFNMWLDPLVCLSVVFKGKDTRVFKLNNRSREGLYVDLSDRSVRRILNEKISSSLIFEDILLPRRRREFRILNRLNLENNIGESTEFSNSKEHIQNDEELMGKDPHLSIDTTQKMKRFLWPRYRVEDLICMNRFWWNRHNRSQSFLKVRMYPKMDHWDSWDNLLFLITDYIKKLLFLIKKLLFLMYSVIKKIPILS